MAYQVWFRAMPVAVDRAARRGDVRRHRFRSRHGPGNDRLLILAPRINPCRRSSRRKSRRRKASGGSLTAHGSIDERSPSPVPSAASPGRSADRRTSSSRGSTSAPSHPTCGTPNLRHTSGTFFPRDISTSASRSFPMIRSAVNFVPRGIDCPPSLATTSRFSLQSWSRLKGAGQPASLAGFSALRRRESWGRRASRVVTTNSGDRRGRACGRRRGKRQVAGRRVANSRRGPASQRQLGLCSGSPVVSGGAGHGSRNSRVRRVNVRQKGAPTRGAAPSQRMPIDSSFRIAMSE